MPPRKVKVIEPQTISHVGTFQKRIDERTKAYEKDYNIEELNDSNDKALLFTLIRSELILEDLQNKMQEVLEQCDIVEAAQELKKLSDLIRDTTTQITSIQRTLNIDRKSRKSEDTDNIADYIRTLKSSAKSFLDKRLIKVYCPDCKVLVARFSPVHHHTAFSINMQCDQCKKFVRSRRQERDIWFDVRPQDADWRRKYPAEIIQPVAKSDFEVKDDSLDDDIVIAPTVPITDTAQLEVEGEIEQKDKELAESVEISDFSL